MSKVRIDINEVFAMAKRRGEINRLNLADIEWTDGDKVLDIPASRVERWNLTGLNNVDFVVLGCHSDEMILLDVA